MYQVDNGVIDHLLPSLHENDWDVLIAHFLGVVSCLCSLWSWLTHLILSFVELEAYEINFL
jgi:hypothetical protein